MSVPLHVIPSWTEHANVFDPRAIGAKAAGLFRLPRLWVPHFVVLTAAFSDLVQENGSAALAFLKIDRDEAQCVEDLLSWTRCRSSRVLVRSNAQDEHLYDRGSHYSYTVEPELGQICDALDAIRDRSGAKMCAIVQTAVEPCLPGHMSNERRVTSRPSRWLVETEQGRQRFIKSSNAAPRPDLTASDEKSLHERLREVAGFLLRSGSGSYHCEWVWDETRLWIVQCDEATSSHSMEAHPFANEYILKSTAVALPSYKATFPFEHFSNTAHTWRKLNRPKQFARLSLPTADVFFLGGEDWHRYKRGENRSLEHELSKICESPTVIRCDISEEAEREDLLLKTSGASTDLKILLDFMEETSKWFEDGGLKASQWAFLLSHLVPAQASAMIRALPGAEYVRVDSLWGFPDGLLHYPHDTAFYYPDDKQVEIHTRYKSLVVLPDGLGWKTHALASPLDWRQVLNREEVQTVAQWALSLANDQKCEVQLMALARISGRRGVEGCLPWHYTTLDVPQYSEGLLAPASSSLLGIISDHKDIESYRLKGTTTQLRGYQILPVTSLLRNEAFLIEAAGLASEHKMPLFFEGSLLGHAYYIMHRTGASLIPLAFEPQRKKRKIYGKLVRDQIPAIIQKAGGLARVSEVPRSQARELLTQKLIEEAFEVRDASADQQSIIDEIADLLDVVDELRKYSGVSDLALDSVRAKRRERRGGFSRLLFLEETEIRPLKMDNESTGHMALFGSDPVLPSRRKSEMSRDFVRFGPVVGSDEILKAAISLIPPAEASSATSVGRIPVKLEVALRDALTSDPNGHLAAQISYQGAWATLRICLQSDPVPSPEQQLVLDLSLPSPEASS